MPAWRVKVTDGGDSPVREAEVSLVRESEVSKVRVDPEVVPRKNAAGQDLPLMVEQVPGQYIYALGLATPYEGNWRLIVRKAGRATVVQPITIVESKNGGFVARPRNLDPAGPTVEVATVEIKTVHNNGDSLTTFTVTQPAHSEIVLMSGTQYGTDPVTNRAREPLRTFAEGRRDVLATATLVAGRGIDNGTIVTLWSLDDRATFFFAKARTGAKGWILVHRVAKPGTPPEPITPGSPWPSNPDQNSRAFAIHPDELYRYLHEIGKSPAMRGRVREVSIFSHAYEEGPILYNTSDESPTPNERDPNDFDCRTKDWEPLTLYAHGHAAKAMSPKGRWHIWGCLTNSELVAMTAKANLSRQQGKSDDELFVVNHTGKRGRYEARIDRRRVLRRHLELLRGRDRRAPRSYPGMLVATLGCDVFAALPGTWSNFSKEARSMFVDDDPHSWPIIEKYYEEEAALRAAFEPGRGIDGQRYVNYRRFSGIGFPSVAPRSAEYEFRFSTRANKSFIQFHGGQIFRTRGKATVTSERIADVGSIVDSLAGRPGHRYVLTRASNGNAIGVLAVDAGTAVRVFGLDRTEEGGPFDFATDEIPPP